MLWELIMSHIGRPTKLSQNVILFGNRIFTGKSNMAQDNVSYKRQTLGENGEETSKMRARWDGCPNQGLPKHTSIQESNMEHIPPWYLQIQTKP